MDIYLIYENYAGELYLEYVTSSEEDAKKYVDLMNKTSIRNSYFYSKSKLESRIDFSKFVFYKEVSLCLENNRYSIDMEDIEYSDLERASSRDIFKNTYMDVEDGDISICVEVKDIDNANLEVYNKLTKVIKELNNLKDKNFNNEEISSMLKDILKNNKIGE